MNSGLVKTQKWIVCVFAVLFAITPQISQAKFQKVLFGDGNPNNGFEDDRELLSSAQGTGQSPQAAVFRGPMAPAGALADSYLSTDALSLESSILTFPEKPRTFSLRKGL